MVSKQIIWRAAAVSLAICGGASAGPVLLASYEDHRAGFSAPGEIPEVQFVLQLGAVPQPVNPATSLGVGIWWSEEDEGFVDFTPEGSPAFSAIATRATDGVIDQFASLTVFAGGSSYGSIDSESYLYGKASDLAGYRLDLIRLVVENVHFEPRVFDEFQNFLVSTSLKYEFYGVPIPEPHSIALLGVGICAALPLERPRRS